MKNVCLVINGFPCLTKYGKLDSYTIEYNDKDGVYTLHISYYEVVIFPSGDIAISVIKYEDDGVYNLFNIDRTRDNKNYLIKCDDREEERIKIEIEECNVDFMFKAMGYTLNCKDTSEIIINATDLAKLNMYSTRNDNDVKIKSVSVNKNTDGCFDFDREYAIPYASSCDKYLYTDEINTKQLTLSIEFMPDVYAVLLDDTVYVLGSSEQQAIAAFYAVFYDEVEFGNRYKPCLAAEDAQITEYEYVELIEKVPKRK